MTKNYLSYKEKYEYINKINKFYKYDSTIINQFMDEKNKIFEDGNNKKQKLTNSEIKSLLILAKKTIKFLDDFSIDYWLDGGSLLGALRNGKMIKWDDDIDLAIIEDQYIKLNEIIKKLGIKEDKYYIFKKYDIKFCIIYSNEAINKNLKNWLVKVEHLTNNNNKVLFIDLLSYIKNNKNQYASNNKYFYENYIYNISDIYPLRRIKFENQYFKCVNNPIPYLNKGYWFWYHLGRITHTHFPNENIIDRRSYFKLNLNEKILEYLQKIFK